MLWKISRRENNPNLLFLGRDLNVYCRIMKVQNNNSKNFLAVSLMIVLLKELTIVLSISHG